MKPLIRALAITIMALAAIHASASQPTAGSRVSILVVSPGAEVYSLEGHAALRIVDAGDDFVVTWGLFDFDSPGFIYRFVKGETDYLCGAWPTGFTLGLYRAEGRGVRELTLNLTPAQVENVERLVADNLKPENRVYRYNYVKDNCSTRPISIIERAVGDSIIFSDTAAGVTFRSAMTAYHKDYPWYQFGIDLALGPGIDYPIGGRGQAYAPVALPGLLSRARWARGGRPVISSSTLLVEPSPQPLSKPTPWYLTPMAAALAVLALTLGVSVADLRRRRVSRWLDSALFTLAGLTGLVLAFLVFISTHEATSPNWLLAWLNPLALIAGLLLWLKSCRKVVLYYHFANFATLIILAIAWPWLGQTGNWAFLPLAAADLLRSTVNIKLSR